MCLLLVGVGCYLFFVDKAIHTSIRTMQDTIWSMDEVDMRGLRDLQVSGGPVLDFPKLKKQFAGRLADVVIVDAVDIAYKDQGYINDITTFFLGYHKSKTSDSRYLLRRLVFTGTTEKRPELVVSEEEMARRYGFKYKKVYTDHKVAVDDVVSFFDTLPESTWIHVHCRGGRGHTSILLVMLDIMKNAPRVSLNDIVKRQFLLGSQDLFDTSPWKGSTYTPEMLQQRKRFIEQFYDFICQRKAGGVQRWSEWRKKYVSGEDR